MRSSRRRSPRGLASSCPIALPRAARKRRQAGSRRSRRRCRSWRGRVKAAIRTRKVAILVADGVDGASLKTLHAALTDAGAVPRFVGPRLGTYSTADGDTIEADVSMENSPVVLFDALVLPDGDAGVAALGADGHTMEFVVNAVPPLQDDPDVRRVARAARAGRDRAASRRAGRCRIAHHQVREGGRRRQVLHGCIGEASPSRARNRSAPCLAARHPGADDEGPRPRGARVSPTRAPETSEHRAPAGYC